MNMTHYNFLLKIYLIKKKNKRVYMGKKKPKKQKQKQSGL